MTRDKKQQNECVYCSSYTNITTTTLKEENKALLIKKTICDDKNQI